MNSLDYDVMLNRQQSDSMVSIQKKLLAYLESKYLDIIEKFTSNMNSIETEIMVCIGQQTKNTTKKYLFYVVLVAAK